MTLTATTIMRLGLLVFFSVSPLFADRIIDNTFDDNSHEMELWWYCYDDNRHVGPNDRPQAAPEKQPTTIDGVSFTQTQRQNVPGDDWIVREYEFSVGNSDGKSCAIMPFTLGDEWTASYGNATPYCGIGALMAKEGESIDMTGVTAFRFDIKSRVQELRVRFMVQIKDIDDYSDKNLNDTFIGDEFTYHGAQITTTPGQWTTHTITIDELRQPQWLPATSSIKMPFDITQVTKIAWEVRGEQGTIDTLDLAEVVLIDDICPHHDDIWMETVAMPQNGCMFADFETYPKNESPLGTYWYAYSDVEIGGGSAVVEDYATVNETTNLLNIVLAEGNGSDGVGTAPVLGFELGEAVPQEGVDVAGFVGIGCNLYDSTTATYWDAEADGATGIYFEYYTEGNDEYLIFELSDINDVPDIDNPDRKDLRGTGIVHCMKFPPTAGEWKKVSVPLDELAIHENWDGYNPIDLDMSNLAKVVWKIEGAQGTTGKFGIDNVFFEGMDYYLRVKNVAKAPKASGIHAFSMNGTIRIALSTKIMKGEVTLMNTKGAIVDRVAVSQATNLTSLPTGRLSSGLYFVDIRGVDENGKAIEKKAKFNLMK